MSSHNGRFPSKESDLNDYFLVAAPYLIGNATRFAISTANVNTITTALAAWNLLYSPTQNPDTRTKTATDSKNAASKDLQAIMRTIFADLPQSQLTAQDQNTLNLPERSTSHSLIPAPTSRPVAHVDTSQHLQHSLTITDEATPHSTAKPAGVHSCQVWAKKGSPVVDPSELVFLGTSTKSPFVTNFTGADAGKPIYYWLRWENTHGETGPWSDQVMATIAG